ncbi:hypothetical protein [Nakamurella deserti]|uniref:hypothetical protein n=1 Tax=Nakamurella deserti TaxID=2164074 RepID=UPI000DBE3777|nr:hypothetical protein [Nakamurella deserti]
MKRVLVLLCAVLMGLVWVAPAQAAAKPTWEKPTAPSAVVVAAGKTPAQAVLSWSSPAKAGSKKIYGYSIVKEGGGARSVYWQKADRNTSKGYVRTFANLKPGVRVSFTVKAWSLAGSSPAATVTYTPAAAASVPTVYSVDTAAGRLVAVPTTGGTPVTVFSAPDISGLVADASGNVYFTAGGALKKVAAGGVVSTVATGVSGDLDVDQAGNVYAVNGRDIVRISPAGKKTVVFTATEDVDHFTVTAAGAVTVKYVTESVETTIVTIAPGEAPASRVVDCLAYCFGSGMLGDDAGTVYINVVATGASGFSWWPRLAAGATVVESVENSLVRFAAAVGPADRFYLLETTHLCVGPPHHPEDPNPPCVDDDTVKQVEVINPDGTSAGAVPVSGLTLPGQGGDLAVDGKGAFYLASSNGLAGIPAAGGAATVLASGSFRDVVVVG